ncbi:MAG: PHP domain-containing protein [Woeseiaceae bacterium]|nr:PHP domain-containing protein [Woeseiaceae bacterium]
MIYDLHTHTSASDGSLAPAELLAHAAGCGVDVLSITDHDTVAAYDLLGKLPPGSPTLVPGIELSTTWAGRGVHIVGLNIDPGSTVLRAGIAAQQAARNERAETIARRLEKLGFGDARADVADAAAGSGVGRPHFARYLVNNGYVKDVATAFRKYLGDGKAGDVRSGWATLEDVIRWIRAAGGSAVLAHPAKYRLTRTKLCALIEDFVSAGGVAIEVVSGPQEPGVTRRLGALAADYGLAVSAGSDFHHPASTWSAPGRFPKMPDGLRPVWDLWPT